MAQIKDDLRDGLAWEGMAWIGTFMGCLRCHVLAGKWLTPQCSSHLYLGAIRKRGISCCLEKPHGIVWEKSIKILLCQYTAWHYITSQPSSCQNDCTTATNTHFPAHCKSTLDSNLSTILSASLTQLSAERQQKINTRPQNFILGCETQLACDQSGCFLKAL